MQEREDDTDTSVQGKVNTLTANSESGALRGLDPNCGLHGWPGVFIGDQGGRGQGPLCCRWGVVVK